MMGGGNMQQMMMQAQRLQQQMQKVQEEAGEMQVEATAGGGAVKVVANGKKQILDIVISPDAVDPDDVEMLQDIIVAAVNEGIKRVQDASASEMSALAAKYGIPDGAF